MGSCCTHGNQGRVRQTASHMELHGKVADDRIDDCTLGGASVEFLDVGRPD